MKGLDKLKSRLKKTLIRNARNSPIEENRSLGQPRIMKKGAVVASVHRTQFIIGLDFGTSYTKVAVSGLENIYIVELLTDQHLIPTRFFVDKNGVCNLNSDRYKEVAVDKVKLIEGKARTADLVVMVAYCALILKSTRHWAMINESQRLANYDIDWLLNVGLPTESSQDRKLTDNYRTIMHAAWKFSTLKHNFKLQDIEDYLAFDEDPEHMSSDEFMGLDGDCLSLFPEFIGQIQSYIRSPQRQKFAHLLIDVGGGTVDVAVFRVIESDGEYRYPLYGKRVRTLGAVVLEKKRNILGRAAADKWMMSEFKAQIAEVITCIPPGRYEEDIQCIFIGGGSDLPLYKKALKEYQESQQKYYPLRVTGLRQPNELCNSNLNKNDFHRFSVAYGLTVEPDDLGYLERGIATKIKPYQKTLNAYLLDASK